MNPIRMVAVLLMVLGIAGLAYGGFTYTKETHKANIGSIELSVKDKQTVNVPMWAGVGAVLVGVVLLLVPPKK